MASQGLKISAVPVGGIQPDILLRPIEYNPNVSQGISNFDARMLLQARPVESALEGAQSAIGTLRQRQAMQATGQELEQQDRLFPERLLQEKAQTEAAQYARDLQEAGKDQALAEAKMSAEEKARRDANIDVEKERALIDARGKMQLEQMQKMQEFQSGQLDQRHAAEMEQLQVKNASAQEIEAAKARHQLERDQAKTAMMFGTGKLGSMMPGNKMQEAEYKEKLKRETEESKEAIKHGYKQVETLDKFYLEEGPKAKSNLESAAQFKAANAREGSGLYTTVKSAFGGSILDKDIAAMNQAQFELLFSNKPTGLGTMTETDKKDLLKRGLNISNPKEVNDFIADRIMVYNQSVADSEKYWNQLKDQVGNAQAGLDFRKNWNKYENEQPYFVKTKGGELTPNPYRVPADVYFGIRSFDPENKLEKAQFALWKSGKNLNPEEQARLKGIIEQNATFSFKPPWESGNEAAQGGGPSSEKSKMKKK